MSKDVDFVLKSTRENKRPAAKKSWFSKLPADAQKRLIVVKKAYNEGRFAGVALVVVFEAIQALLRENKWPVPSSIDTVVRWLRSTDTST